MLMLLKPLLLAAAVAAVACSPSTATTPPIMTETTAPAASVYDFTLKTIDGKDVKLSQYKGKKLLIVNTASECGYTPQYKELEQLYKAHGDKVVVLGFPANNFGGQEPGTEKQIATFCEKNYGVTFPLFSKVSVKGDDTTPLYQYLATATGEKPSWNFCKYLVDENGKVLKFYKSSVTPMSTELLADIAK